MHWAAIFTSIGAGLGGLAIVIAVVQLGGRRAKTDCGCRSARSACGPVLSKRVMPGDEAAEWAISYSAATAASCPEHSQAGVDEWLRANSR
jgi:hypothetical protein